MKGPKRWTERKSEIKSVRAIEEEEEEKEVTNTNEEEE